MGKAKKAKAREKRNKRAAGFSVPDDDSTEIHIDNKIINKQEIMAGLNSPDLATREGAAAMISSIFGNASQGIDSAKALGYSKLVKGGVTKRLIKCLFDEAITVRELAASTVRNMCASGQSLVLKQLISDDILTPLLKHLEDLITKPTIAGQEKYKQSMIAQILESLTYLLDFSEPTVCRFTQRSGPVFVLNLLHPPHQDMDTLALAVQVLYIASDSNIAFAETLHGIEGAVNLISQAAQSEALPLIVRLYAVGVALNLGPGEGGDPAAARAAAAAAALPLLAAALGGAGGGGGEGGGGGGGGGGADLGEAAAACCEAILAAEREAVAALEEADQVPMDKAKRKDGAANAATQAGDRFEQRKDELLKAFGDRMAPLKLALELVANLSAAGDDEEEERDWASDDEGAMEAAAAAAGAAAGGAGAGSAGALAQAVGDRPDLTNQVLQALGALCAPPGLAALPPGAARWVAEDALTLRHVAACAAANLLGALPPAALGDLGAVWRGLLDLCGRMAAEARALGAGVLRETVNAAGTAPDLWFQSLTATLPVLLRRFGAELAAGGLVTEEALGGLLQLCQWPGGAEVRCNALAALGALGAAPHPPEQNLLLAGAFAAACRDPSPLVAAEALNTVMDVYADEDHNASYEASGLRAVVDAIIPDFKAKVKQDGQALGREQYLFLKETSLNIIRFKKYKDSTMK